MKSAYLFSKKFQHYKLSEDHPFDPLRSKLAYQTMLKHGLLDHSGVQLLEHLTLDLDSILTAHSAKYVKALQEANEGRFERYMYDMGLGSDDCPIFPGVFEMSALAAGGTMLAVKMVESGDLDFAFNPMGGYHHAGPARASGFCYLNDVNIAIKHLVSRGLKVAYVDLDAHHGNGVQDFFYEDDRVLFISIHESGKYLYPGSGFETQIGEGKGKGYTVNVPLEPSSDDEVFNYCFNNVVPRLLEAFKPDFVVGVLGMDSLANDPLTHLRLTNNGFTDAVKVLHELSPRWVALGAGGYEMNNLARGWALSWAVIHGLKTEDDQMGLLGGSFTGSGELGLASLRDPGTFTSGPQKEKALRQAAGVISYLKGTVFPILGAKTK